MVLVCAVQWLGVGEAVAAELTIVSAGMSRTDGMVSLVVDVRSAASEPISPASFSVVARTLPQWIDTVPLVSDQLAVGFVVDGSEDGRTALPSGLAGAADFVLGQPLTGAAVVADKSPPTVMSTAEARPADAVRALNAIDASGQRQTSEALTVVLRELERIPARSRMVVLHTAAADAGGESAIDLAARLTDSHTALAVVSTAADSGYWLDVTRSTGGVLVTRGAGNAFVAFDQVAAAMRSRYLLTFTPTAQPPFAVTVRVATAEGSATAHARVPEPPANPAALPPVPADPYNGPGWPLLLAITALLVALCLHFLVLIRQSRLAPQLRRARLPDAYPAPATAKAPEAQAPASAGPPAASTMADPPDTSTPSPPRPARPSASTPPPDHYLDTPDTQAVCLCGCGGKVRPGRVFFNWEHQSRWMSRGGRWWR